MKMKVSVPVLGINLITNKYEMPLANQINVVSVPVLGINLITLHLKTCITTMPTSIVTAES